LDFLDVKDEPIQEGSRAVMHSEQLTNFETSLPYGSCAPRGDGALRHAGGAV
jgi:hypothetical protein